MAWLLKVAFLLPLFELCCSFFLPYDGSFLEGLRVNGLTQPRASICASPNPNNSFLDYREVHVCLATNKSQKNLGFGFKSLPPAQVVTNIGGSVSIPCNYFALRGIKVTASWSTKKGTQVNQSIKFYENGTLLIPKVTRRDRKYYRCLLKTNKGILMSPFVKVDIAETGLWQISPRDADQFEGSAARLTCVLSANPPIVSSWLKDGAALIVDDRHYFPAPGVLQIRNLQKKDSGEYKCVAVNRMTGEKTQSGGGTLTVKSKKDMASNFRPKFVGVPTVMEVKRYEGAALECLSDDPTGPTLTWTRQDERKIDFSRVNIVGQGSLSFQSIQESDAGVYNCSIKSALLVNQISNIIEVVVNSGPVIHGVSSSVLAVSGDAVQRVICNATGYPRPRITWYKDGEELTNPRYRVIEDASRPAAIGTTLALQNVATGDAGIYQCFAENIAGIASEATHVTVSPPNRAPGTPRNLKLGEILPNSIEVSWDPPLSSFSTKSTLNYLIIYYKVGDKTFSQLVSDETHCKLVDLEPGATYSLSIRAFVTNEANTSLGEPSKDIEWKTPNPVDDFSYDFFIETFNGTDLRVYWNLTDELDYPETVEWRLKGNESLVSSEKVFPAAGEHIISDLCTGHVYEIRLKKKMEFGPNSAPKSPWREVKIGRNQGLFLEITADNKLLLVWNISPYSAALSWCSNSLPIPDYFLVQTTELLTNNRGNQEKHKAFGVTSSSFFLKELRPGTLYSVSVAPSSSKSIGEFIRSVTFRTTVKVVPAPRDLSYFVVSTSEVIISWTPPQELADIMESYELKYSFDLTFWTNITLDKNVTSVKLIGLISNIDYTVKVSAVSNGTVGEDSTVTFSIHAVLLQHSSITTVFICITAFLAVVTFFVVVSVCWKMRNIKTRQPVHNLERNGSCVVPSNGVDARIPYSGGETNMNNHWPIKHIPSPSHENYFDTKVCVRDGYSSKNSKQMLVELKADEEETALTSLISSY